MHHGHRRSGREPLENSEGRHEQRVCHRLVRDKLGLAQYGRFVVAELEAVHRRALVAIVAWLRGDPTTMRCADRPGHAGVREGDKERKKPRPENKGAERSTVTA